MEHFKIYGTIDDHIVFCLDVTQNVYTEGWNVIQYGKGIVMWDDDVKSVNNYIDAAVASMVHVFEYLNENGHNCIMHNVGAHVHRINKEGGYVVDAE
jgi:hypothetical protein